MPARAKSIRRKLITAIMGTSITVLVLACAGFVVYEVITFRTGLQRGLSARAEIVGDNSTAALAFRNQDDATEVLSAFKHDPRMIAACLYDEKGDLFAKYPADAPASVFPSQPQASGNYFAKDHFGIFVPIMQGNRWLGTVFLKYDLSALTDRYRYYSILVALIFASAALVAYGLSRRLQRGIAGPVSSLVNTARAVSQQKDYSLRAPKVTDDEIGLLTDAMNDMLHQIEQRDEAVQRNEARLRAVLESALDAIVTMDHEGNIVEFNPAAQKMFGYKREQAIGKPLADLLIPPSFRDRHWKGLAHFRKTGEAPVMNKHLELPAMRSDGSEFPVELTITQMSQQGPPLFTGFLRDITERKRAETSRALLAGIVESSDDAIISKDLDGIVTSWNAGAERLFGYTAAEVLGQSVNILIPREHSDEEPRILAVIRSGKPVEHYETVRMRKDGKRLDVSLTVSPLQDATGKITGASSIARDITERKRAEEEIRKLNAELEQRVIERTAQLDASNKEMEAFSYSVSHDLRSPLRGIDGFSKALLEDYGDRLEEEGKHQLQRVRAATQRMGRLIDDLLKLSRISRADIQSQQVDLSAIARQIAADLKQSQPNRQVTFKIQDGLTAEGDSHLLQVVLDNLLSNAWKYTSKHPTATIEFATASQNGERIFMVRDDGAGFDMAHASLLFAPFQRVHRQTDFEGTGIGLATVQRVICRHNGRIWVEAAVEQGATFYFTIENKESTS